MIVVHNKSKTKRPNMAKQRFSKICTHEGCDTKSRVGGLCHKHRIKESICTDCFKPYRKITGCNTGKCEPCNKLNFFKKKQTCRVCGVYSQSTIINNVCERHTEDKVCKIEGCYAANSKLSPYCSHHKPEKRCSFFIPERLCGNKCKEGRNCPKHDGPKYTTAKPTSTCLFLVPGKVCDTYTGKQVHRCPKHLGK